MARIRYNEIFSGRFYLDLLVSGAAGFIGSHLCDRLLAEGHSVLGLDNLLTGSRDNIAHLERHSRFEFRRQDVGKSFDANGDFDGVLHLASPASPKDYLGLPVETLEVSSCGTRNMLEVARRCNARFLLTSTSEAYGDPAEHPQSESYWGHVNPVGPRSCYDEGKRFAEALTMAYHRTFGLRTSIARIFNTYGPRMKLKDGRVVPTFLDQALRRQPVTVFGDGTQTRSFCYVSDMVEGLYRLFLSEERYPINLGNPAEMSIREFAEYICRLTGVPFKAEYKPLPPDDPKKRRPDISKAKKSLGWEPHVSLEDGLRKTIEYFRPRMTFI
ncbi:MAG TPA: UDP-glucuronic acid decarboxylase family protein [Bryobacteraceae bacterium]|nr:UDP-glucuronic acid decarboxylase family protein [Bryobacteraceae bacterium]